MLEQQKSFPVDPDYSQLLSGAHRKPVTPVGAPALIAHFAFWQPRSNDPDEREAGAKSPQTETKDDSDSQSNRGQTKAEWTLHTDTYIHAIYCIIKEMNLETPNTELGGTGPDPKSIFLFSKAIETKSRNFTLISQKELPENYKIDRYFPSRNPAIIFNFVWHNIQASLRFERHTEFFCITAFLDLSLEFEPSSESSKILHDAFANLSEELENYRIELKNKKSEDINGNDWREKFFPIHSKLYSKIWESFIDEILLSDDTMENLGFSSPNPAASYNAAQLQRKVGGLFVNFRGLVIGSGRPDGSPENQYPALQLPAWRKQGSTQKYSLGPRLSEADAALRTRELWPFVTSEPRIPLAKTELSVSRMLKGRTIFITTLGTQPSQYLEDDETNKPVPVYYLAYVTTFSRWQIGRLIDTVNHLGTVRLAAIKELQKLSVVSGELRSILLPNDQIGVTKAQKKIVGWDQRFLGGLNFRVERSRYYVQQFMSGLDFLEISNVAGYQSYDKFVLRRLGSTFDFINRLGIRVERIKFDLNAIAQALNTIELTKLAGQSTKLTSQLTEYTSESANHTKKLVDLQDFAELFVYLFIGPYYVIGIIDHIVMNYCPKPNGLTHSIIATVYFGISLLFLRIALGKYIASIIKNGELDKLLRSRHRKILFDLVTRILFVRY